MVQVKVNEGILEGQLVDNPYGESFYSFKGIPYAEPPVGELRFKTPQPLKPWEGVRAAKDFGPVCVQFNIFENKYEENASEDCLYLNVYSPNIKPDKPLPVMFWIHGGAFSSGYGNDKLYGPHYLLRKDVIVVTCNYRLEVLGFLSLETKDVPGNAGLKDQVAALRWVKDNISNFGGDPQNITIFGESAGAASVSFHLVSPMTKGLFKRAIMQSGALTCWFSQNFKPRERAFALARKLGFYSEDDKELYEFFKSQPVENLIYINTPFTLSEKAKASHEINFSVVSEKDLGDNERYFYGDPIDVLKNGIHEGVEVIAGYNQDEGILSLALGSSLESMFDQGTNFPEFFVPKPIALNCAIGVQLEVGKKIKQFYFKDSRLSMDQVMNLLDFQGMNLFVFGVYQFLRIVSSSNNTVYGYRFSCKSQLNALSLMVAGKIFTERIPVGHADDLSYMFTNKMGPPVDQNSKEFELIEKVTDLWCNFAKYGNPTPDKSSTTKWLPFSHNKQEFYDIGEFKFGPTPENEAAMFWEGIFEKYYPPASARL